VTSAEVNTTASGTAASPTGSQTGAAVGDMVRVPGVAAGLLALVGAALSL